jgi:hypothetical protein
MRRRKFISVIGGAAAWPLAASAQQGERMRLLGGLMGLPENDPEGQAWTAAFEQSLADLGWSSGSNLRLIYRFPEGVLERTQKFAKELVGLRPDVIFASNTPAVVALQRRPARFQLSSRISLIRSKLAWCRTWRTLVEMSPGLRDSSLRWLVNGSRFLGRQFLTLPELRSCSIRTRLPMLQNTLRYCGFLELLLEWRQEPHRFARSVIWNQPSPPKGVSQEAVLLLCQAILRM